MKQVKVAATSEFAQNEVRQVEIAGRAAIAVYHLDGEFYATDDMCTHGDASLAEGDIEGGEIICPFHLGAFDIRTGEATVPPCVAPINTYAVHVDDGIVYVEVDV